MKKFYLLGLLGFSAMALAQTPSQSNATGKATIRATRAVEREIPSPVIESTYAQSKIKNQKFGKTAGGTVNMKIGTTMFVNQTGNATYRRTNAYSDGKVSVTWTTTNDNGTNGFLSRGSGYNSYNGTTWSSSPNSSPRIETFRTGFPCMVATPDNKEIVIAHRIDTNGLSQGLAVSTNTGIGSGTWSTTTVLQPAPQTQAMLWPRAAVSGDYMIVLANYQDSTANQPIKVVKNGVESPLVYSRYKFSTGTWVDEDMTFPNYDYDLFVEGSPDVYSIDAKGNDVAVVAGYYFSNLVLWKSADNGATWTMKILDSFPVPHYRYDKDSLPVTAVSNGSCHVLVDNAGKAHVFSGMARIQDSILGDGFFTYTYSRIIGGVNDAILYWSEYNPDSSLRIIASAMPIAGDSSVAAGSFTEATRRYGISNSTYPSAGIDAEGKIFLTYSALTPTDVTADGTNANYRDILVTYSTDNGTNWATPQNITQHLGTNIEQVYPTIAKFVNDRIHVSYLGKALPGNSVPASSTDVFDINYLTVPVAQILGNTVGMLENEAPFTIAQNYPNPFHGSTNIDVHFNRSTSATITVTDIMGKVITSETYDQIPAGKSNIELHVGEIPAGVYLYSIEADGFKTTQRMMVN
ncbi:MAG: T9SS type A sorting domain-containing protein [Bacteroidia bacterium]|jgi:hypothetical protein